MAGTIRHNTLESSPSTQFYMYADLYSQSVSGNYSRIRVYLRAINRGSTASFYGGSGTHRAYVNGDLVRNHTGDPFLPSGYSQGSNRWYEGPYYINVPHNADGTKQNVDIRMYLDYGNVHYDSTVHLDLPTIPRASTPSFSPDPVDAGEEMTITTNRASTSFTHDITYTFGSASGTIDTDVGASTTWTPPLSLLEQIPDSVSGQGTITTKTYSGSTLVGTKNKNFTLRAPSSVVPDFTTVTHSEATTGLDALVGAYVQGLTTLNLAITGATGVYGSTITDYKITVAGQIIHAASGVTPNAVTSSGTVAIVGTITDSRGRKASKTVNIDVLAYSPPSIDTGVFGINRADAGGTIDPEGDRIRIDLKAAVQSLVVGSVEKNEMTVRVYTRLRGDTTWDLQETVTPGDIVYDSYILISPYAVENSWEVRVSVLDEFVAANIQGTVATAAIFMHWGDTDEGLGVGKFWEQGGLDVLGQIYQNDGKAVLDETDLESIVSSQLPAGFIASWPTDTAPANWLLCQGQAVSRTTYASLFAAIGTTYGAGDGSTTFNVPDFRGRSPIGWDGSQPDFDTLGEAFGAKNHAHGMAAARVRLGITGSDIIFDRITESFTGNVRFAASGGQSGSHSMPYKTLLDGSSDDGSSVHPVRVVNFIIKASNGDTPGDSQLTNRVSALESATPTAVTFAGVNHIDFTDLTGYDEYELTLKVLSSSAVSSIYLQLLSGGVPVVSGYDSEITFGSVATAGAAEYKNIEQWIATVGSRFEHTVTARVFGLGAAEKTSGHATIYSIGNASDANGFSLRVSSGFRHRSAVAYNGIRIKVEGGPVTGRATIKKIKYE